MSALVMAAGQPRPAPEPAPITIVRDQRPVPSAKPFHVVPARLAARLFDPDAYILGSACFKVHNIAVVTLAVKNMVLGAPLHQIAKEAKASHLER